MRGERATLSHQFEQRQYFNRAKFSVNILQFLKDAVITVGVSFCLCSSFSVDHSHFDLVNWLLALEATEPVSELVIQMALELINLHLISLQQKR